MTPGVMIHVAAGGVAILAGFAALAVKKGDGAHRAVGTAFFVSMLVMAGFGGVMSLPLPQGARDMNVIAALLTLYLVTTAWMTVRRPAGTAGLAERLALILGLGVAATAAALGPQNAGPAAPIFVVFGSLAAFSAAMDLRMIRRGGLAGPDRTARHLWRMCLALFVAAGSFFLGQADEIPQALRGPHLSIPPLAALAAIAWWMVKVKRPFARRKPKLA